jgi:hypothetical protein
MTFKILLNSILLAAFLLFMIGCEAENPGEPKANIAPETYISEASPGNTTTIAFYGTDKDGFVDMFYYQWDGESDWTMTTENSITVSGIFSTQTEERTFYVKGMDDGGAEDPTPAEITLTATNALPETQITGGPEFGRESGEDVTFTFEGTDVESDGSIEKFEYTMDDLGHWTETDVDNPQATYLGLAEGAHTFYVRAIDNLDGADPTPAQIAFIVKSGKYSPTIVNNSAVKDGGGYFAGVALTFTFSGIVADYYGMLSVTPWSFAMNDATNFDDSNNPLASGWIESSSFTVPAADMVAGMGTFYVKCRDTGGGISTASVTFEVAAFNPTSGILVIDDMNFVPTGYADDAELTSKLENGFFNGYSFTVRSETAPAAGPGDLADYSTVILYSDNGYQNQNNGDLFAAYATAGGNLMITGYNLVALAPTFGNYGLTDAVYGYGTGNYGGMDGIAGTAYENWHINLPAGNTDRLYQRVYSDAANTEEIFSVRGNDGDTRSCGARADMPNGNVVIVIGQSIPFFDQDQQDTKDFGNYVLGTEFGETKK